jgi:hypothetical protein
VGSRHLKPAPEGGCTLSWLSDLASSFGIPVVAASIAGSIYAALSKAEKVARPEALAEISAVLKDPSWSRSVKPWSVVERLFVWTFGERHFSLKCISRSAVATAIIVTSLVILHIASTGDWDLLSWMTAFKVWPLTVFITAVILAFVPDYLALLKTRKFLMIEHRYPAILILCVDAASSIVISIAIYFVTGTLSRLATAPESVKAMHVYDYFRAVSDAMNPVHEFRELSNDFSNPGDSLYSAFYFSTLFTSIWLTLIVLSSTFLKLLAPLHRFTAWFFDVQKHPLEAVGIVAGALVMLGVAIGTIVQKL